MNRALVLSSQPLCAQAFCQLLKTTNKNFSHIETCFSLQDAAIKLQQQPFNYLFTSIVDDQNTFNKFIADCRNTFNKLIIIVVNTSSDPSIITGLLKRGANAYLTHSAFYTELETAIERTQQGEKYISSEAATLFITGDFEKETTGLTRRELEVLQLVAKGLSIGETANQMHLSQHTVINHRRHIMEKLGVHSAPEIVKYAYENNLVY